MGAPCLGAPFKLQLPPRLIQAAGSLYRHRGAAARLCFQVNRGRVTTGLCLAMTGLNQDLLKEQNLELPCNTTVCQHYFTSQAPDHRLSCMTPRRQSVPGARTRLRGQKLPSLKSGLDPPASLSASLPASSELSLPGPGVRSKCANKGNASLFLPSHPRTKGGVSPLEHQAPPARIPESFTTGPLEVTTALRFFFKVLDQSSILQTAPASLGGTAVNLANMTGVPPTLSVLPHILPAQEEEQDTIGGASGSPHELESVN
ncbi:hypothetical protein NDU88_003473 [Pleurodeles waltl]|uniref:Uncharacterized protein n=1 Tax=Pleurodeles waltl TaxID=8319 RepID=A0AAV7NKS9_PLEWA|nr:hypothetical protein NDU88_003473 [Pleurodeles waltl]